MATQTRDIKCYSLIHLQLFRRQTCKLQAKWLPTKETDSVHASPVILQTNASSSTVSTMSREQ